MATLLEEISLRGRVANIVLRDDRPDARSVAMQLRAKVNLTDRGENRVSKIGGGRITPNRAKVLLFEILLLNIYAHDPGVYTEFVACMRDGRLMENQVQARYIREIAKRHGLVVPSF